MLPILCIILLVPWILRPRIINRTYIYMIIVFLTITILHIVNFGEIVLLANLGFLLLLLIAILANVLIDQLWYYYCWIMVWLSLVSLMFHIPYLFGFDVFNALSSLQIASDTPGQISFGIYQSHPFARERNCGMFWEPSAFAGYLIIALTICSLIKDKKTLLPSWAVIILVITLITTMSTTGYLAGAVLAIYVINNSRLIDTTASTPRILLARSLLSLAFIGLFVIIYQENEFMGEKISSQSEQTLSRSLQHKWQQTRFGSLLYDLDFVMEKPLIGWSMTPQTRTIIDSQAVDLNSASGNGLSNFLVRFGVLGAYVFVIGLYRGLSSLMVSRQSSLAALLIFFIILSGEQYLNFPVFWFLLFPNIALNESVVIS